MDFLGYFKKVVNWLSKFGKDFSDFLIDLVLFIPRAIYSIFCDITAYFLNIVNSYFPPVGNIYYFITNINKSTVGYFLDYFQFVFGLKCIFLSYIVRFLIRRIPFIG